MWKREKQHWTHRWEEGEDHCPDNDFHSEDDNHEQEVLEDTEWGGWRLGACWVDLATTGHVTSRFERPHIHWGKGVLFPSCVTCLHVVQDAIPYS